MLSGILGFLSALPKLLDLANGIWAWINKISGNDPEGWIIKTNEAFAALHKAETEEDMIAAAKKIQDLIHHTH